MDSESAVTGRQVAELAAAAAHRKNLDQDEVLGQRSPAMRSNPSRRQVPRHRSSGAGLRRGVSGDGLRAMSRSIGSSGAPGNEPSRRVPNRTRSLHTSGPSPMLSRSVARSGGGLRRSDGPLDDGAPQQRGLGRSRSSFTTSRHRPAPEHRSVARADSSRGVPSRRGVGRTCSQGSLAHMSQNGRDRVQRADSSMSRLSLMRSSVDDRSVGELSNFTMATMDSVNLRKQQIIADPVDDGATYREADSVADHDSVSMATNDMLDYREFVPRADPSHVPYDGVSVADTVGSLDSSPESPRGRLLEDTRLVDATHHSHPDDIACDAVSLSTINTTSIAYGGEGDIDESSYIEDYESTLREEIEAFDEEDDEDDESSVEEPEFQFSGVKEREGEE